MRFNRRFFLSFFVVIFCIFFIHPHNVYAGTDPIAYWKFDDGSGTTPIDSSGNNITGTFLTPNPTWSTDVPPVSFSDPYSLDFSNYHDGVTFSWPSGLNFGSTDPRTFSFWYKATGDGEADSGQFDRLISWDSDAFEIAGTYGSVSVHELAFYDGSWRDTGYALSVGTWYHITFTYDGTSAKFYVGNDLKYSGAEGGRALSGTMAIGTRQNGHNEGINGRIDDVRVYNYALDTSQIANLTAGSSDPDAPPATPTPTITPTPIPQNSSNSSQNSSSPCAAVLNNAPNLYQINPSQTSATIYFTPVSASNSYYISYGTTTAANQFATSFNDTDYSGAVKYTINNLNTNTTYYFKVRGGNGCSGGFWSNVKESLTNNISTSKNFISQTTNVFAPTKKLDIISSKIVATTSKTVKTFSGSRGINLDVKVLAMNNTPIVGAVVTLHSKVKTAKTDKNGVAHFTNVEKGQHKVLLAYNGYQGQESLTVSGNKKSQTLTMQVKLSNGVSFGIFAVVVVILIAIIGALLFIVFRNRKKQPLIVS